MFAVWGGQGNRLPKFTKIFPKIPEYFYNFSCIFWEDMLK